MDWKSDSNIVRLTKELEAKRRRREELQEQLAGAEARLGRARAVLDDVRAMASAGVKTSRSVQDAENGAAELEAHRSKTKGLLLQIDGEVPVLERALEIAAQEAAARSAEALHDELETGFDRVARALDELAQAEAIVADVYRRSLSGFPKVEAEAAFVCEWNGLDPYSRPGTRLNAQAAANYRERAKATLHGARTALRRHQAKRPGHVAEVA
jgi:DNA repair exonuclease SbcCD ATPase subunit